MECGQLLRPVGDSLPCIVLHSARMEYINKLCRQQVYPLHGGAVFLGLRKTWSLEGHRGNGKDGVCHRQPVFHGLQAAARDRRLRRNREGSRALLCSKPLKHMSSAVDHPLNVGHLFKHMVPETTQTRLFLKILCEVPGYRYGNSLSADRKWTGCSQTWRQRSTGLASLRGCAHCGMTASWNPSATGRSRALHSCPLSAVNPSTVGRTERGFFIFVVHDEQLHAPLKHVNHHHDPAI